MWKFILLLSSLIVGEASIDNCLGEWVETALNINNNIRNTFHCDKFEFRKAPANSECVCDDGRKATLITIREMEESRIRQKKPAILVDAPNTFKLDVECTCGSDKYNSRSAFRSIDKNNFIVYEVGKGILEPYVIVLLSRDIPSKAKWDATIQVIDDFKNKTVEPICTTENLLKQH